MMDTTDSPSSSYPDPETWSHIQETIIMLYLAVCQIEASMSDSSDSVNTLTASFTDLAEHSQDVNKQVQQLQSDDTIDQFKQDMAATAEKMQEQISKAITAFQFFDRVSQRLDHVARSLESVTQVMSDSKTINQPNAWKSIQEQVKSNYTMEAERIMYEHIMRGASVREALEIYRHHFTDTDSPTESDEIELF